MRMQFDVSPCLFQTDQFKRLILRLDIVRPGQVEERIAKVVRPDAVGGRHVQRGVDHLDERAMASRDDELVEVDHE